MPIASSFTPQTLSVAGFRCAVQIPRNFACKRLCLPLPQIRLSPGQNSYLANSCTALVDRLLLPRSLIGNEVGSRGTNGRTTLTKQIRSISHKAEKICSREFQSHSAKNRLLTAGQADRFRAAGEPDAADRRGGQHGSRCPLSRRQRIGQFAECRCHCEQQFNANDHHFLRGTA